MGTSPSDNQHRRLASRDDSAVFVVLSSYLAQLAYTQDIQEALREAQRVKGLIVRLPVYADYSEQSPGPDGE